MKRKILVGALFVCFALMLNGCNKAEKEINLSGEEVLGILENNNYTITHRYYSGGNIYDRVGKCYNYAGVQQDCVRELNNSMEYLVIDISYADGDGDFTFFIEEDGNVMLYTIYDEEIPISYEMSQNGKELVGYYSFDENKCIYEIKTVKDESWEENTIPCTNSEEEAINTVIDEMVNKLIELKLTTDDLFIFVDYYYDEYMKAQKTEIDNDILNNGTFSQEEVLEAIEAIDFEIKVEHTNDYKIVTIYDAFNTFELHVKNNRVSYIIYHYKIYEGITFLVNPESDGIMGSANDYACSYNIKTFGENVYEVTDGYTCTTQEMNNIEVLSYLYEWGIGDFGLKEQELINFAIDYGNE